MAAKIYVLTEALDVSIPIFQRVSKDQRVPVKKRNSFDIHLQLTVQDKEGVSKNIRYKEACPSYDQDEQIEKYKIPANTKFTNSEYKDKNFTNGILHTTKVNLQNYMEAYPGFDKSPFESDGVASKQYMLYDKSNENKIQNAETRLRVRAASKVLDLELADAQELLIRLNGSFFETPNDVEECQNLLMTFVDATDEDGLNEILKENNTNDEVATILIGKLLKSKLLSFTEKDGFVSKKDVTGKWIDVKAINAELLEERKRLFAEYLLSPMGDSLLADLKKEVKLFDESAAKSKEKINKTSG